MKNILISGAGPSGLTLAYWLQHYGFTPTVIERFPTLRTGGYKIDIRGVALEVTRRMGIFPSIVASKTDIQGVTFVDGSGNVLTTMSADLCGTRHEGDLEIVRGDLCTILFNKIPNVEYLFGDSVKRITEDANGVEVEFEQHSPRRFDLVIGADGLHSVVRKLVFGEEGEFLKKLGTYVSVYTIPNFLSLDRREIEYHNLGIFVNVHSVKGATDAKAGFAFSSEPIEFDPYNIEQQKALVKKAFQGVGWEVPRLLSYIDETPDFYFDAIAQTHMPHWTKGRTALVGDAGYGPSPLSGQGTSLAIVGAYVLAGELKEAKGDYRKAFLQYEKELSHFVKKNQALAKTSSSLMKKSKWSFHALLIRILPEKWIHFLKNLGLRRTIKAANAIKLKSYDTTS